MTHLRGSQCPPPEKYPETKVDHKSGLSFSMRSFLIKRFDIMWSLLEIDIHSYFSPIKRTIYAFN